MCKSVKDVLKGLFLATCVIGGAIGGYSGGCEMLGEAVDIKNGVSRLINKKNDEPETEATDVAEEES